MFQIERDATQDPDHWATATVTADGPALVEATARFLRESYGEEVLITIARTLLEEAIADGAFRIDHLQAAIRTSLPDPGREGAKPPHLTTWRSQPAELVAKLALRAAFGVTYPAAPQAASLNANQPILGFDGWGLLEVPGNSTALVLIQAKGTDSSGVPTPVAEALAEECCAVPTDPSAIARALCAMVMLVEQPDIQAALLRMLEVLGSGNLPPLVVAPAVVKGLPPVAMGDLSPVAAVTSRIRPASARGIAVRVGMSLEAFGMAVTTRARESA